jgi:hypothetical protein
MSKERRRSQTSEIRSRGLRAASVTWSIGVVCRPDEGPRARAVRKVVETPFDRPDTRSRPSLRRGEGRYGGFGERDVDRVRSMIEERPRRPHRARDREGGAHAGRACLHRRASHASSALADSHRRLDSEAAAGGEVAPLNPSRTTHEPSRCLIRLGHLRRPGSVGPGDRGVTYGMPRVVASAMGV